MTIERWRRLGRSTAATQRDPWSRLPAAARRLARQGERCCDHLHDTVSRYDHTAKRLELLLTCPVCQTEKVIHSLAYEPRFEPSVQASTHFTRARARRSTRSTAWPGREAVPTEISQAVPFWEAEPEHQDYLQRYPNGYTCHFPRPGWKLPHRETAG